ncbi:MAG: tRNA (adenosine(37)-N6)-dimethylallyltransferase MiaA [Proteobacteria bacterium]|nr:tRNA (adenosine(37)-N6)-dimethylallyltransferase MiaA [Pseudomonadota bacterium]
MNDKKQPVLIVAGPTASGKSGLALAIAVEFDGVVINADSMQVYSELRVLTARPSPEDEARAPHRLYGVLPASEVCSAGRWRDMALAEIESAHAVGKLPIVCGGTGLYLKALTEGLSPMPDVPDDIRERVRARLTAEGAETLHRELSARDPAISKRLEPADGQRIVRALEVLEATGRPLSEWQADPAPGPPAGLRFATILLTPPREELYARCDLRLEAMLDEGALDEVRRLNAMGLAPDLPATRALGVKAFSDYLAEYITLEQALTDAQQSTRNYAKRQFTWFRHKIVADTTVSAQFSESLLPKIFSFVRHFILTHKD